MKILLISLHYRPEPNFITADVAEKLASDHDVTVVTAHPNYPQGHFAPGTKYWCPVRTVEHGVTVWRVPMFPDHSTSKFRRFLSYMSFTLAATLIAPFVAGLPHVVWVYQTPPTAAFAALWFKLVARSRLVFMYADLWPESFMASGVAAGGRTINAMLALRRSLNRLADEVIRSTKGTLEKFAEEGVSLSRLHLVPVWVEGVSDLDMKAADRGTVPRIVYAGNIGPCQYLEPIIHAGAELARERAPVRIELYGTGTDEPALRQLAKETGATVVHFMGRVAPAEAFSRSATATAQIVALRPGPLFRRTVPSKLFFCFAAGAPVLYALEGEASEIAAASGGSIPYDANDPATLAAAIRSLLRKSPTEVEGMRERLREHYRRTFHPQALLEQHKRIVEHLHASASENRDAVSGTAA